MSIRFEKVGKEFPKLDMLDELNREAFPDSEMADEYRKLAEQILAVCEAIG